MALCIFNGTLGGTQKWWSQLFLLGFHITLMGWGHFLRVFYSKIHSKNSIFENFVIWKPSTKSWDHPHVIPLWVQLMVQYVVCGEPLKK